MFVVGDGGSWADGRWRSTSSWPLGRCLASDDCGGSYSSWGLMREANQKSPSGVWSGPSSATAFYLMYGVST